MTTTAQGVATNGASMKAIRLLLGTSQTAIAREAGISGQYLGQLERGIRTSASIDVLAALAAALRVDVRALMAIPGPASSTNTEQVQASAAVA